MPEDLSRDIGRTVEAMLRREKYEDFGSIEGDLRSMTKGNRFECEIHDEQRDLKCPLPLLALHATSGESGRNYSSWSKSPS
jgi:hypothetical protein